MKKLFAKLVSGVLSLAMLLQMLPSHAMAAADQYIPELEFGADILESDVFYLTAATAALYEGIGQRYILRIGRGGNCESAAGVTVKISDMTAKYGKDYTVSLLGGAPAENPADNLSLLERMENEEYTETPLIDEEQFDALAEQDETLWDLRVEGVNAAIDYLETESGVPLGEEYTMGGKEQTGEIPAQPEYEEAAPSDSLQSARQLFTGVAGPQQRVTATEDAFQQVQQMANVITRIVVGASLKVDFQAGEREKYIAIDVNDDKEGNGNRYFYLMLTEPYGTTTNSSASNCAVTIIDDEVQEPSRISFGQPRYSADGDSVEVDIVREGAMNTVAAVNVTSAGIDAQVGRDFSPVDTSVVFPIGIDRRTLSIPVETRHIENEADFQLTLESEAGCTVEDDSATVTILGTAGEAMLAASSGVWESISANDVVTEDAALNLCYPVTSGDDCDSDSTNSYQNGGWKIHWQDAVYWPNEDNGWVGASWDLANPDWWVVIQEKGLSSGLAELINGGFYANNTLSRPDIAGVQVHVEKGSECCGRLVFALEKRGAFGTWKNIENDVVLAYDETETGSFVKPAMNLFFNGNDIGRLKMLLYGNCGNCDTVLLRSARLIKRPFIINLHAPLEGHRLTFLKADGTYETLDEANQVYLLGAPNDGGKSLTVYSDTAVTFTQTLGNNPRMPYTYISGMEIAVPNSNGYYLPVEFWTDDTNTSRTIKMTTQWIQGCGNAIIYEENQTDSWKNPNADKLPNGSKYGYRGRIEMYPQFGYKDVELKINVPENDPGYFNISGTDYDLDQGALIENTYHRGDILRLTPRVRSDNKVDYEPVGFVVSSKMNASDSDEKWMLKDVFVPYVYENDELCGYVDLDAVNDHRLQYGYYEITPVFQIRGNNLTVRVKATDIEKFDTSYGVFATPVTSTYVDGNGVEYRDHIVYSDVKYGETYALSAKLKDGSENLYPTWTTVGNSSTYVGDAFFHSAGFSAESNVITLAPVEQAADQYLKLSGTICSPFFNSMYQSVSYSHARPAEGAIINFGNAFAVADENGNFSVPALRCPSNPGGAKYRLTYLISYNGGTKLCELVLQDKAPVSESVDFMVKTENGTHTMEQRIVNVRHQSMKDLQITPENGNIAQCIEVSHDMSGTEEMILLDNDTENVTVYAAYHDEFTYRRPSVEDGRVVYEENAVENIEKVEFSVYNSATRAVYGSWEAELQADGRYKCDIPTADIMGGELLLVKVTTDRRNSAFGVYDDNGSFSSAYNNAGMDKTSYNEVFTGISFGQRQGYAVMARQTVDLPIDAAFTTLPIVGDAGVSLNFPYFQCSLEKTDNGWRMSFGTSVGSIVDKVNDSNLTGMNSATGSDYSSLFSYANPFSSYGESIKTAFKDIKNAGQGAFTDQDGKLALGGATWCMDVNVGIYFDFMVLEWIDPYTAQTRRECVFSGVGGYLAVSASFSYDVYFIIPVVMLPGYIGITIDGSVLGTFGAAAKDQAPKLRYDDAVYQSLDFDSTLDRFDASVNVCASVQLYAGIGFAKTLGLRGGGQLDAMFLWHPSELTDDCGFALTFQAGIWVDLVLFTIPLLYSFPLLQYGSFAQSVEPDISVSSSKSEFEVRPPLAEGESQWQPMELMAGFGERSSQLMVRDGYEHPDAQLVKLTGSADNTMFMAFLDNRASYEGIERTVLKYSVMDAGGNWSDPVAVWDDGTADFQPSACETRDGKVMISWISREASTAADIAPVEYLTGLEVYTTVIDTNSGSVGQITRLTKDDIYDYTPTSVYDDTTGDMAVYYVKADKADGSTAVDLANSYSNDCIIAYMLCSDPGDGGGRRWLTDYYFDDELSGATPEEKFHNMDLLIRAWNGQRFISGPQLGNTVANIADFNAIDYNGLAVYAYTIDMDSRNDTSNDRELFIQVYDFTTHKTYKHIRLTDDSLTDALPQMVRSGSGEGAMTTLFWYRDDKQVAYINLSTLIKEHIADDGSLLLTHPTKAGKTITREDLYSYVSLPTDNKSGNQAMSDFKAVTDNNNIFIVWTRPFMDPADPGRQCRELYATALVRDGDASGSDWANPYRLTKAGKIIDEPEVAIDGNGDLIAVYNQYEQEITKDPDNPVLLKNMQLRASTLEPCGDVDVTGIALSKALPRAGEQIKLIVNVTNNGLTRAEDGYTITIREKKDGVSGEMIGTLNSSEKLLPGNTDSYELMWTVPEDFAGVSIYAEAMENGYEDISKYETVALQATPYYEISNERVYLADDGYHIAGTLTNKGNAPSQTTDKLSLTISGPYNMAINYTPERKTLLDAELGVVLEPEDTMSFDRLLTFRDPGVFHRFGFIDCLARVNRVNSEPLLKDTPNVTDLSDAVSMRIMAQKPSDYKLNGKALSESITLEVGETLPLEITCTPGTLQSTLMPSFTAEDTNIARVEDGALVAVSAGRTILSGVVMPYGDRLEDVEIIVRGESRPDTPAEPQIPYLPPVVPVSHVSGNEITLEVTANNGAAQASVSALDMNAAAENAGRSAGEPVVIRPKVRGDAASFTVELPKSALQSLADGGSASLVIDTGTGCVTIPADTLCEIVEQAEGETVTIRIAKRPAGALDARVGEDALNGALIAEVSVESRGNSLSLDGSPITVSIPASENHREGSNYAVIILSVEGELIRTFGTCQDGQLLVHANHPGTVIVTAEELPAFVDVADSQYFHDPVLWALANGVTNGTSDTTFSPHANCTRGQVVTFLWRAAGSPASSVSIPFTDVSKDAYYYEACRWAVENGITNGTGADKFSPDETVTRAQMVTFLHRFAKVTDFFENSTFEDVYADAYYAEAVRWAASSGITSGTSDSTFSPDAMCTRGQTVTFLYRLFH